MTEEAPMIRSILKATGQILLGIAVLFGVMHIFNEGSVILIFISTTLI